MKSTAELFTLLALAALAGCSDSEPGATDDVAPGDAGAHTAAGASAATGPASAELVEIPASELVMMRCGDHIVAARYLDSPSAVELELGDSLARLPQVVSASGARYADENQRVVWWNKGDSATLTRRGQTTLCGPLPHAD